MKHQAYSVYDSKAKFFSHPFYCQNDEIAIRNFTQAASDPASQLCKFPADFSLFLIGNYDDEIGFLTSIPHHNLGLASQFKTTE